MVVWGGNDGTSPVNTGARFEPVTNSWLAALPTAAAPSGRWNHTAVWTGTQMIVWGGDEAGGSVNTGGIYQPTIPATGSYVVFITTSATGPGGTRVQIITVNVTIT
jgi:hypothetical protein